MERSLIIDTTKKIGQKVKICGWVNSRRDHGKLVFLDLRDRTGLVQVVGGASLSNARPESVLEIIGLVKKRPEKLTNPKLATGKIEIEAQEVNILARAAEMPFDVGDPEIKVTLPTLLDYRPLSLRHQKARAIFKVQETIIAAFRKSLKDQDFTEIQVPTIVPSVTEGGAQVFKVKYFDKDVYLGQSPQLYKQMMVGVFERVFTLAHAYRAEPSITTRHMTEYISLDVEMGFIDTFEDIIAVVENVVRDIFKALKQERKEELALFSATVPKISQPIPRIKMREAQEIIFQRTGRDNRQEPDLEPEDEREIYRYAVEKYGSELIFITHYPTKKRPFYTYPDPKDPDFTYSFDLLGRGLEWVTGGQRINNYQQLVENIKKWGNRPEDFEIYLQAFKYGMPPEGGFALGAERITMQVLGLDNIRAASLFPRDMERVDIRLSGAKKASVKGGEIFDKIVGFLKENKIKHQVFEHEPVYTSEQAAKVRGTKIQQGAKALVMMADGKPVILVISAALKVDTSAFKKAFAVKDLRMITAEEVKEITGIDIGAVPPFGNLMGIEMYVDKSLGENKEIAFNAGLHTRSIKMAYSDWLSLAKPVLGDFSTNG